MNKKEYIKIAKKVMYKCGFDYFQNRGWMIIKCAQYMQKVCKERNISVNPNDLHLPHIAKHFYITEINRNYAVH